MVEKVIRKIKVYCEIFLYEIVVIDVAMRARQNNNYISIAGVHMACQVNQSQE